MSEPTEARRVDLVYIDSGGGHRAAATALSAVIREREPGWDVRMVSIQDILAPIDIVRQTTGIAFQDVYNIMLKRGWTAGSAQIIPLMHFAIRVLHPSQVRVLQRYWEERRPDLVVSLIPHFNRALKESLDRARPGTPYVTVLTDIADYPPHFWIEPQDQYVICGSDRAVSQAHEAGIPERQVFRVSGMIVDPRFCERAHADRREERARLGLDPDRPAGLVLFGGEGSMDLVEVARELNHPDSGVQLILLCGKHETALRALQDMPRTIPMHVEGFTKQVPLYMELADFFIGKPGPGSISEAIAKRLPLIVLRNQWTLAHELYNCRWIEEQGLGLAVNGTAGLRTAVQELLAPARYADIRRRLSQTENRAVFEIPELLEGILARHSARNDAASSLQAAC